MTTPDTSAEVERIRATETTGDCLDALAEAGLRGEMIVAGHAGHMLFDAARAVARLLDERDALRERVADLSRRHDLVASLSMRRTKALDEAREEIDRLRALLPSPAATSRAWRTAAEIVEVQIAAEREWRPEHRRGERDVANSIAAHIRDRARTQSGTRDEGGDVDGDTLRRCAEDVDGCTTLGELEGLVAKWREVRGG